MQENQTNGTGTSGRHRAPSTARAYLAAGVAMAGVSVLAVNPAVQSSTTSQVEREVRLAADSIANVPINLAIDIINVPANELTALNNWSDALQAGDSWFLKTPTNVWGWDPGNPPMLEAAVAVLVPFPVISGNGGLPAGIDVNNPAHITAGNSILGGSAEPGTLGYILNVIVAAETPMHEGCGFTCGDLLGAADGYFKVPIADILDGYTFPVISNPNQDPNNPYPPAWSGATVPPIDPTEPFTNFLTSLTKDPSENPVQSVSLQDALHTLQRLNDSATLAFNPYFPGSYFIEGAPTYDADVLIQGIVDGTLERTCPLCGNIIPSSVTNLPTELIDGFNKAVAPASNAYKSALTDYVTEHPYLALDTYLPKTTSATQQEVTGALPVTRQSEPTTQAEPTSAAPEVKPDVLTQKLPSPSADNPDPTPLGNLTTLTTGASKVTQGQSGVGKHRASSGGGLADGVKSATNGISSAISKAVKSVTGGNVTGKSGKSETGKSESKKAGKGR
jgi:hypothetical protein